MQRIAQGNLAASGVQVEANPMFVTFVSPQEKEKLTTQGYRALTTEQLISEKENPPVPTAQKSVA